MSNIVTKISDFFSKKVKNAPLFNRGNFYASNGNFSASWRPFDVVNNILHYNNLAEVSAPINKQAKSFLRAIPKIVDKKGKQIENHWFTSLLDVPNPLQSYSEFFYQIYVSIIVAGYAIINIGNVPLGFKAKSNLLVDKRNNFNMHLIPAERVHYQLKYGVDYLNVSSYNDLFERIYYTTESGAQLPINFDTTFVISNVGLGSIDKLFLGDSVFTRLQFPISNLYAIYESDNVFLSNLGAIGAWTGDGGEFNILEDSEKEAFQNMMAGYGLRNGQYKNIVTTKQMKWQSTTQDIRAFEFMQKTKAFADTISAAVGTPPILNSVGEGTTYANIASAEKQMFQDSIIPNAELISDAINKFFEFENGEYFSFDFAKVECLQAEKEQSANVNAMNTNTIIQLNVSVSTGQMSRESAVAFSTEILGLTADVANMVISKIPEAKKKLGTPKKIQQNDTNINAENSEA